MAVTETTSVHRDQNSHITSMTFRGLPVPPLGSEEHGEESRRPGAGELYLNERGGGLGSGGHGSVGEVGGQRRLLCQKRLSGIRAHGGLRHDLGEKGEVRTPSLAAPEGVATSRWQYPSLP